MGIFNYTVDIDKDVDINVDVNLDVDKFVASFTNIQGYLAVAEASADAFGGTSTIPGGRFVIDDFNGDEPPSQIVSDPDDIPPDPPSLLTIIDDSGTATEPCGPQPSDGPNWVMNEPGTNAGWTRTIEADLDSGDRVETEICYECDAGHLLSGSGDGSGTSSFIYAPGPSGEPINVLAELGSDDIDSINFQYGGELDGGIVQFTFRGNGLEIVVTSDPIDATGGSAPEHLLPFSLEIDDPNEQLVFGALDSVVIEIIGDDVPNLDAILDCVELVGSGVGEGALAETETFAQVDQVNGFTEAFSMSLAATSEAEFDVIVT